MVFGRKKPAEEQRDPIESIFTIDDPTVNGEPTVIDESSEPVDPGAALLPDLPVEHHDQQQPKQDPGPRQQGTSPSMMLTQVLNRIDFLNTQFDERLKYDESRELQVNKLYDELDAYRQNAQIEQMLVLARGIFMVLDKLEPDSPFQMTLEHLREELVECLAVVGIDRIEDPIESLEAPSQIVVGFLDSDSAVVSRIRQHGYRRGELVVRARHIETKKN